MSVESPKHAPIMIESLKSAVDNSGPKDTLALDTKKRALTEVAEDMVTTNSIAIMLNVDALHGTVNVHANNHESVTNVVPLSIIPMATDLLSSVSVLDCDVSVKTHITAGPVVGSATLTPVTASVATVKDMTKIVDDAKDKSGADATGTAIYANCKKKKKGEEHKFSSTLDRCSGPLPTEIPKTTRIKTEYIV